MLDRISAALSRRNLLMGLAVSATAATVADAAAIPKENPELIAMADALPDVLAEYVAARDSLRAIVAEWSPQWPVPNEEIRCHGNGCKDYRDIEGRGIAVHWGVGGLKRVPQIGTPEYFEGQAAYHFAELERCLRKPSQRRAKFHRIWAEKARANVEPSRTFWSEVDRITAVSGIGAAQDRHMFAKEAFKVAVDRIMMAEDWTITGAVIKAQALTAWAEVDGFERMFNDRGPEWANRLAASIVRQAA